MCVLQLYSKINLDQTLPVITRAWWWGLKTQVTWADFADRAWLHLQTLCQDKPFDDEDDASPW